MDTLTVGQLINALLDIPAEQHNQKVVIYGTDGSWIGSAKASGQYDSDDLSDPDNPFVIEAD